MHAQKQITKKYSTGTHAVQLGQKELREGARGYQNKWARVNIEAGWLFATKVLVSVADRKLVTQPKSHLKGEHRPRDPPNYLHPQIAAGELSARFCQAKGVDMISFALLRCRRCTLVLKVCMRFLCM